MPVNDRSVPADADADAVAVAVTVATAPADYQAVLRATPAYQSAPTTSRTDSFL